MFRALLLLPNDFRPDLSTFTSTGCIKMTWILIGFIFVGVSVGACLAYAFLIRPWHMSWGATEVEATESLAGDELVPFPKSRATHAVTVGAAPEEVWPWLVQLGQDRAGFYSYTFLENLLGCRMRNTFRIVPEWQHLSAGDGVLFHPNMPRIPAAIVEPNRVLVIGSRLDPKTGNPVGGNCSDPNSCLATSWAFFLRKMDDGNTRWIVRLRGQWPKGIQGWLINRLFWEPAHFVMEWKMLRTVKRLAEKASQRKQLSAKARVAGMCQ